MRPTIAPDSLSTLVAITGGYVVPMTGDPLPDGVGDVVLWSGDLLDALSRAERVLIEGVTIYEAAGPQHGGRFLERLATERPIP